MKHKVLFWIRNKTKNLLNDLIMKLQVIILFMCRCVTVSVPAPGGEGYRVTAQMVLVCCWRSMKEVAMLLGQLCQSLPLHYTNDNAHTHPGLITEEQVRSQRSTEHSSPPQRLNNRHFYCCVPTTNTVQDRLLKLS